MYTVCTILKVTYLVTIKTYILYYNVCTYAYTYLYVRIHMCIANSLFVHVVITVRFSQSSYSVDEDVGIVQPVLVLSNPSSFIETVQVIVTNVSANGMIN